MKNLLLVTLAAGMLLSAKAQTKTDSIPANSADVSTLDGIVNAVYDVISGDSAQKRNWPRMRTLFIPNGKLIGTGTRPDGTFKYRYMTVEDYISLAGPYLEKHGFFERSISNKTEQFGGIAHVFSTYESRNKRDDAKPFERGINSIQLMYDGKRWWVVEILWASENEANPIPEKYLK
jgi:hypothetical protein